MRVSDWVTLAVLGAVVLAIVMGKRKGQAARAAALAQAFADGGKAAALAAARSSVDLGGIHLGGRGYSVGGNDGAIADGDLLPILDAAGTTIGYHSRAVRDHLVGPNTSSELGTGHLRATSPDRQPEGVPYLGRVVPARVREWAVRPDDPASGLSDVG